ncbi:cation efflux protein/zinc transporter [Paraphaeosphaeria sporulosa]
MASTYALPIDNASPARGHGHSHSHSHYAADQSAPRTAQMNGASPSKAQSQAGGAHRHARSEMNGQLYMQGLSPYGHQHNQSHDHAHSHSRSTESTYTLKPFTNGRPKGRPRGESDLGRPGGGKSAAAKQAFSPIHEHPAAFPPQSYSQSYSVTRSWLELPEALTALLVPLPYVFASLAYFSAVSQARKTPTSLADAVADSNSLEYPGGGQLLHACTLSSATLLLVGLISKFRLSTDEPLDRRKDSNEPGCFHPSLVLRASLHALGVMLPFYATMQLGGATTAIFLLVAFTAGLGNLDQRPGKQSAWDNTRRTLRTRTRTYVALLIAMVVCSVTAAERAGVILGFIALVISIFVIPPPLPTTGWSLMSPQTQNGWATQTSTRASLPKPSSPLISTSLDTDLTLATGLVLTCFTVIFAQFSSAAPSLSHHALLFSTLSIASGTASVYLSSPNALHSAKKSGLAIGGLITIVFAQFEHQAWHAYVAFLVVLGATAFDTRAPVLSRPSSRDHSHATHRHSHSHDHDHGHDHHLHGNHSHISAFIIARCTPGSIIHSVMIEKDSRRIAYFGVLNLSFMMVQFFYGYVSGSLGLLTDSIHMLFDCAGLAVGLAAAVMSKWRPNAAFPYGYGKVDTLSGFANGVFLLLVSVEICFDAFERLWEGHELQRLNELLIVSVLGFLVNIVGLTAFGHAHHGHGHDHGHDHGDHGHGHGHSHDNENMQGIFLHILADALGSVAVIISTLLTKYYGWSGWDPIASCIIAILIFFSAIPLVKSAGMRLMLSLPADVEYGIRNTLQELSSLRGVVGYAVPKFWMEDEGAAHAEVHAHEHEKCDHDHVHGNGHVHSHAENEHDHDHSHSPHHHDHSHDDHDHDHDHSHDHDHDHAHASRGQRILGAIHIIAARGADVEDVRERTAQFLKGKGMDVVLHVEREGEGNCWCGGGNKSN